MRKFHGLISFLLGMAMLVFNFRGAFASQDDTNKVKVCHATHSDTNPYVEENVSINSIASTADWLNGHGGHDGDIWPTFIARNGDSISAHGDQSILNNGCKANPTETPKPADTNTPKPEDTKASPTDTSVPPTATNEVIVFCQLFLNGDPSFPDTGYTAPFGAGERQDVVSMVASGVGTVNYRWELWFPTDPTVAHVTGAGTLTNGGSFVISYPASNDWGAPDGFGARESHVTLWIDKPCADKDWDHWFHLQSTPPDQSTPTSYPGPSDTPTNTPNTATPTRVGTLTATATATLAASPTATKPGEFTKTPEGTATLPPGTQVTVVVTPSGTPFGATSTPKPGDTDTPGPKPTETYPATATPVDLVTPEGSRTPLPQGTVVVINTPVQVGETVVPGGTPLVLDYTATPTEQHTGAGDDFPYGGAGGAALALFGVVVMFTAKKWF